METLTTGSINNIGYQLPALCYLSHGDLNIKRKEAVYAILHIKKGFVQLDLNHKNYMISAPAICCFHEKELPELIQKEELDYQLLLFQPSVINMNLSYEVIEEGELRYAEDIWFFTPFYDRSEKYVGIMKINHLMSNYISDKFQCVYKELIEQPDYYWPCRTRSYFLELFVLLKRIQEAERESDQLMLSYQDDEIHKIIEYLRLNYPKKITVSDLIKEFHTNKTTLNTKFKEATGLSPIDFLTHLRIQLSCAMLRDTYIPMTEIMNRTGFIDDAHFNRIFYKHMHCTPAAYRKQYNWMY